MTGDGRWSYVWDGENRLVEMETQAVAFAAGVPRVRLSFGYDGQGRRFEKVLEQWDAGLSAYVEVAGWRYLYDGWNLVATYESQSGGGYALAERFVWGLDLSGSLQGAGGVGGLLAVNAVASGSTYGVQYDGNGNVMGYYDTGTAELVAEFEYGPFGELIRSTGSKADEFSFRFSTKYEDVETGLLYYGYRYYDAETGRWLSRDPIEENGGLNLYGMVNNDSVNHWDYLGLQISRGNSGGDFVSKFKEFFFGPCCDEEREKMHDARRESNSLLWKYDTAVMSYAYREAEDPQAALGIAYLAEAYDYAIDREYRARMRYANCEEEGSLYCGKASARIGAGLDTASLGLLGASSLGVTASVTLPASAVTYSLSVINSSVTLLVCSESEADLRSNLLGFGLSAAPVPGSASAGQSAVATSLSLTKNAIDIFEEE